MNDKATYEGLIFKFLTNEISEEELVLLEVWVKTKKNRKILEDYIKVNHFTNISIHDFNALRAYHNTVQKSKKVKKTRSDIFKYAAAAVVVGLLATGYFFKDTIFENSIDNTPIIVNNTIEVGTSKATLTLEDGSDITLEKGTAYQTAHVTSSGEAIVYNTETTSQEIAFNTITIPRGGQFQIFLSDGTQIWLNSETQIKYPVAFIEGETRQVKLIYGEAYFDVSPSTDHKGAKFKVLNKAQAVEVLGTEFNIKAYKDETNIYTTLVEGKVAINTTVANQILAPNQQSNLDVTTNKLVVYKVDANMETSWKDGNFNFISGKSLKEIMITLSRWYDVEVIFENKALETVKFKGILRKTQSMEEILSAIRSTTINNYEIHDKTIIIK